MRLGRYLVALYDGDEGGQHYSRETFTVTGPTALDGGADSAGSGAASAKPASSDGVPIVAFLAAVVAAMLGGFGFGRRWTASSRAARSSARGPHDHA